MRLRRLFYKALLALLLSHSVQAAAPHWQQADYLTRSFHKIALGVEHGKAAAKVRKWQQPIVFASKIEVGSSEDRALYRDLLSAHLKHLSLITGLEIRPAQKGEQANLTVYFTQAKRMSALLTAHAGGKSVQYERGAVCMASFSTQASGQIQRAVVYIPVDRALMHGKLLSCIVEETTQILGLPNDSEQVYPSIFNDKTPNALLTGLDDLLLRILYSPDVQPGMTPAQLKTVLPGVIQSLSQQGLLHSAERRVRAQSTLYQWLE